MILGSLIYVAGALFWLFAVGYSVGQGHKWGFAEVIITTLLWPISIVMTIGSVLGQLHK